MVLTSDQKKTIYISTGLGGFFFGYILCRLVIVVNLMAGQKGTVPCDMKCNFIL